MGWWEVHAREGKRKGRENKQRVSRKVKEGGGEGKGKKRRKKGVRWTVEEREIKER